MISEQLIANAVQRLSNLNDEEIDRLIKEYFDDQPNLFELVISEPVEYTPDEVQMQLYFGILIWQTMNERLITPPKISQEDIDKAFQKNMSLLEQVDKDSNGDAFVFIELLTNNYPQQNLLLFIIETLIEAGEFELENNETSDLYIENGNKEEERSKGLRVREDILPPILILSKTVIDCLEEAN